MIAFNAQRVPRMRDAKAPGRLSPRLMRDIHVIHRPKPCDFAFATRRTGPPSMGDRDGRPSLQRSGRPPRGTEASRRRGQKNRSPPAGNSGAFGQTTGQPGEAPEEVFVSCAMRHQGIPSGMRRAKQDAMSGCPKKGRRRGQRINLRIGLAVQGSGSLSWCARIEERLAFGLNKLTNTGRSFARRRGAWQQCRALTFWAVQPIGRTTACGCQLASSPLIP